MKIIVFGNLDLPEGSAGATRCVALSHIAKESGYEPILLGVNYSKQNESFGIYEGIRFELLNFDELKFTGRNRIIREKALRRELLKWLYNNCSINDTCCIIAYGAKKELSWLYNDSEISRIPIIKEVCEWFDRSQFQGVFAPFNFIEDRLTLYYRNLKCKNIIAISNLFYDYYKKHGCNVLRIPTILDTQLYKWIIKKTPDCQKIIIAYAGSPAKKDLLLNAVKALILLSDDERQQLQLRFYGIDWSYFEGIGVSGSIKRKLSDSVVCYGRVPYKTVKEKLIEADFTILLRPNKRYANAGFPTKVGESMTMGIPVIANLTSDIGLYLHDCVEGIICQNETPEACAMAYRKAIATSHDSRSKMRINARQQAENSFDYRAYVREFSEFINIIKAVKS